MRRLPVARRASVLNYRVGSWIRLPLYVTEASMASLVVTRSWIYVSAFSNAVRVTPKKSRFDGSLPSSYVRTCDLHLKTHQMEVDSLPMQWSFIFSAFITTHFLPSYVLQKLLLLITTERYLNVQFVLNYTQKKVSLIKKKILWIKQICELLYSQRKVSLI